MSVENKPKYTDEEKAELRKQKDLEKQRKMDEVRKTVHAQAEQFKKSLEPKNLKGFLQIPINYTNVLDTIVEYSIKGFDPVISVPFPQQTFLILKKRDKKTTVEG